MQINNTLLRITDGVTTKNFASGDKMQLLSYKPGVVSAFDQPVEDQFTVEFLDTPSNNRALLNTINSLFAQARNYETSQSGARVYLEFDPGKTGTYWRSLINNGLIELEDDTIGWQLDVGLRLIIHVTREPFWEGALTQIPLSNTSETDNISGLTVTNSYDTTAENFVDIDNADVIGDLPAPIKIELEHSKSGADAAKNIYLFHNVYSNPATFDHILEGEDATGGTVTDSGTDTTSSDDKYTTLAWATTTEALIAEWSLSSALMSAAAGGRFAVLARWRGIFPYSDMWIRLKLLTANNNAMWTGELKLVNSTSELAFLDVMRLGPALTGLANIKAIKLRMYGYRNQSGTHSLPLDYLQLSPISGNAGMKQFVSIDDGVAYQEKLVHDDVEKQLYRVDTSDKLIPEFSDYNGPILLVPNIDQRIYVNSVDKDNEAKVDQTWKVKLWYRPRRSSL
jgi:hypothetical protein